MSILIPVDIEKWDQLSDDVQQQLAAAYPSKYPPRNVATQPPPAQKAAARQAGPPSPDAKPTPGQPVPTAEEQQQIDAVMGKAKVLAKRGQKRAAAKAAGKPKGGQ